MAHPHTLGLMQARYGNAHAAHTQSLAYGDRIEIGGVTVWLAPAGHVLGSSQIVLEYRGLRIVFTGDFKRRFDPTCACFEPVENTHVLVSEATFGLPVFRHPPTEGEIAKLLAALEDNPDRTLCVGAYSLGKAQRVIRHLRLAGHEAPIFVHGSLEKLNMVYAQAGIDLGDLRPATLATKGKKAAEIFRGHIVVAPPGAFDTPWAQRFPDPLIAFASGWMGVRQRVKQSGVELPLVISDHADWDELTATAREVNPEELWITYGREDALVRWAELEGRRARPLRLVGYEEEGS
jgi:putative mRNA 3-end processing factor